MKLKTIVTFLYLLISIPLFLFFYTEVIIWSSFFINYIVITFITYYHLNWERSFSPFLTSYIVFNFLFFIVAPIIQISSIESTNSLFPNAYPYSSFDIVFSNFLILIFNVVFFLSYLYYKKKHTNQRESVIKKDSSFSTPLLILVLFIFCLIILAWNYNYILSEISSSIYIKKEESVASLLLRKKVLFLVPLGAIIITYRYLKTKNKLTTNTIISFLILMILILILLFFKNPLTEKRNALGPIYITLIYLFHPKMINSNAKLFLFLFISMILIFPLMSAITHVDASFEEIVSNPQFVFDQFMKKGGIINTFNTLHYDAFANIMATVEFVGHNGYSWGYQFLSALLFFIPRSMWEAKPLSTGEVIGNYLIEEHNFNFNNLSNPMVSEGFVNFGIFGIFLMAICLSYVIIKFIRWLESSDSLKEIIAFYFAIHLMFLLRGDFTNGFVYFIGPFIGALLIPKIVNKLFKIKATKF